MTFDSVTSGWRSHRLPQASTHALSPSEDSLAQKKPYAASITFNDCNGALRAIALGVCDYLAESTGCPSQLARIPLEGSIIPVVEEMFKDGLALHTLKHGMAPGVDAALLATNAAWAVFGAARRWFQTPNRVPAEEMAARIETMVSPILFGTPQ